MIVPDIFHKHTQNTYIFHIMDVFISLSVAHHFVETEFVFSEENR